MHKYVVHLRRSAKALPGELRTWAIYARKHAKPFALETIWYVRNVSPTSLLAFFALIILAGLSSALSLAIFGGSGAAGKVTINFAEPNRSSSLTFSSRDTAFRTGQPTIVTVKLDTGGAVIKTADITVMTDPSLVELNTVSAVGSACSQLTVLSLNRVTGEATFRCDSINRSTTGQVVNLATLGVTPKASITGFLSIDQNRTKLTDVKDRETFRPSEPFALTVKAGERSDSEKLRVPTTALNAAFTGCTADTTASIRWIKPVGAKNVEFAWSNNGIASTPSTPSSSNGNGFPLKSGTTHLATVRASDGKGGYGPTSVVRVVSCP